MTPFSQASHLTLYLRIKPSMIHLFQKIVLSCFQTRLWLIRKALTVELAISASKPLWLGEKMLIIPITQLLLHRLIFKSRPYTSKSGSRYSCLKKDSTFFVSEQGCMYVRIGNSLLDWKLQKMGFIISPRSIFSHFKNQIFMLLTFVTHLPPLSFF